VQPRRIVFVVFDGFQALDLAGPHEVFQQAGRLSGDYCCQIVAPRPGLARSSSGLPVHAAHGVAGLAPGGIDTLVVARRSTSIPAPGTASPTWPGTPC
jgi:transcriptional regulator GlxA family with amidase domain